MHMHEGWIPGQVYPWTPQPYIQPAPMPTIPPYAPTWTYTAAPSMALKRKADGSIWLEGSAWDEETLRNVRLEIPLYTPAKDVSLNVSLNVSLPSNVTADAVAEAMS